MTNTSIVGYHFSKSQIDNCFLSIWFLLKRQPGVHEGAINQ